MSSLKYDALIKRYEAEIAEAKALLEIYFVGGFDPGSGVHFLDEMDKQIEKLVFSENKIRSLQDLVVVQDGQDLDLEMEGED